MMLTVPVLGCIQLAAKVEAKTGRRNERPNDADGAGLDCIQLAAKLEAKLGLTGRRNERPNDADDAGLNYVPLV